MTHMIHSHYRVVPFQLAEMKMGEKEREKEKEKGKQRNRLNLSIYFCFLYSYSEQSIVLSAQFVDVCVFTYLYLI